MKRSTRRGAGKDEETLARLLAEAVERLHRGERPAAAEYIARHPALESDIVAGFEAMLALEEAHGSGGARACPDAIPAAGRCGAEEAPEDPRGFSLEDLLSGLPPLVQRLIYLRCLEKRRWTEITALVGKPELEVRRLYARAIAEILSRERAAAAGAPGFAR